MSCIFVINTMQLPRASFAAVFAATAAFLATTNGKATCEVPFRKSTSTSKNQLLRVATAAFDGNCKIGEFPGLQRSIDTFCYLERLGKSLDGFAFCRN